MLLNLLNEFVFANKPRNKTIRVYENTAARRKAADNIILNHTAWAAAVGVVPFVNIDMFAISALQLDMVRKLADVYDVDFEQNKGRATIVSLFGSGIAGFSTRMVRWIPLIGLPLGGITMTVMAGTTTYAAGEAFRRHFESGGTFLDIDFTEIQTFFKNNLEKGRSVVEKIAI
jgi:uncharacterized protein (DUF697 family)